MVARFHVARSIWLARFRDQYPSDFEVLEEAGITDDESFHLKCGSLPRRTCILAETMRFDSS